MRDISVTVNELLNTLVTQFNNMYPEKEMEREATIDDVDNMRTITDMMMAAFYQKAVADLAAKIQSVKDHVAASPDVSKRKFGKKHP